MKKKMFYEHLNKYRGLSKGQTGAIVQKANISIPVSAGVSTYKLEQNSSIERNVVVGLWVTKTGVKVDALNSQMSAAAFDSAYLVIRQKSNVPYSKVPFEQIRLANEQGRPYYINLDGHINLSESTVMVPDNAAIAVNTVAELQVDYIETV